MPPDYDAQIARCDAEIAAIEARAATDEPAYLVVMGTEDWRAERCLLVAARERQQP